MVSLALAIGGSGVSYAAGTMPEASNRESLPFTFESTDYGVQNEDVTAHSLKITEENTYVEAVLNHHLLIIRQKRSSNEDRIYLVGQKGLLKQYTIEPGDENWINTKDSYEFLGSVPAVSGLIQADMFTETYSDEHKGEYEDVLYRVLNPETGKYDIINATKGIYHAWGLDETYLIRGQGQLCRSVGILRDGKYGLMDLSGEIICEPEFEGKITAVDEGVYYSYSGERYTFFNDQGMIGKKDGYVEFQAAEDGLISCRGENNLYGVLDYENSKVLEECEYDEAYFIGGAVALTKFYSNDQDNWWKTWLVSREGTVDLAARYGAEFAEPYSGEFAAEAFLYGEGVCGIRFGTVGSYGSTFLVDARGDRLYEFDKEAVYEEYAGDYCIRTSDREGREADYAVLDKKGNEVLYLGRGTSAEVEGQDGKYLFVRWKDTNGAFWGAIYDTEEERYILKEEGVTFPEFNFGFYYETDHALQVDRTVKDGDSQYGEYGLFNTATGTFRFWKNEEERPEPELEYQGSDGIWFASGEGSGLLYDGNFQAAAELSDSIDYFTDSGNLIHAEGKYTVYDRNGNVLVSYWLGRHNIKQWLKCMDLVPVCTEKSGDYGYCDQEGNLVVEPRFGKASDMRFGLAYVQEDLQTHGVIDAQGNEVIYGDYDYLGYAPQDYSGYMNEAVLIERDEKNIYYFYDMTEICIQESAKLDEDDLFGACYEYLDNPLYRSMQSGLHDAAVDVLASRNAGDDVWGALKTLMTGGMSRTLKEYLGYLGYEITAHEAEDAAAVSLVNQMQGSREILQRVHEKVNESYEWTSEIYELLDSAAKGMKLTYLDKLKVAKAISGKALSPHQALKIVNGVQQQWGNLEGIFEKADVAADFLSVSVTVISLANIEYELTEELLNVTAEGSSFYQGLKRLQKRLQGDYVVKECLKKFVLEELAEQTCKAVIQVGATNLLSLFTETSGLAAGGAYTLASAAYWLAGTLMPVASSDEVLTANFYMSASIALASALQTERTQVEIHYNQTGQSAGKEQRERYKFVYTAYVTSLKAMAESFEAIAKDDSKKAALVYCRSCYGGKLTWKQYLESCLGNMNRDKNGGYAYRVKEDGTAAITELRRVPGAGDTAVISIPSSVEGYTVTSIDPSALEGNLEIAGIFLPDGTTGIGAGAFRNCSSLDVVMAGDSLETIGEQAFENCTSLQKIKMPETVREIGTDAFGGCQDLVLVCREDSGAANLAGQQGMTVEAAENPVAGLEIVREADRKEFLSSEEIDLQGLILKAVYEDGTQESVSEGYQLLSTEREAGANTVLVIYKGRSVSCEIILKADETHPETCLVRYQDETGTKLLADRQIQGIFGTLAKETAPEIPGYTPVVRELEFSVGSEDVQTFVYRKNPKNNLETAEIFGRTSYLYTGSPIVPDFTVSWQGQTLKEGTDYTVVLENNTAPGTAEAVILGTGSFEGVLAWTFQIQPESGKDPDGDSDPEKPDNGGNAGDGNNGNGTGDNGSKGPGPQQVKVSHIRISGISKKIAAGKKIALKAEVFPEKASNRAVAWSSSNPRVGTVNSRGVVTMKKGLGGKSVTITARALDGSGISARYRITSMKGIVKKITVTGAKTVRAGKSLKLRAKVKATKKANTKLRWTSSNTGYATVSSTGKVKTKKAGKGKKVIITASATDGSGRKRKTVIRLR